MTSIGIGTQTPEQALATLSDMTNMLIPIQPEEHLARIAQAQAYMQANNIDAIYLNAGTNLTYFTGMKWYASERMVGAILPAKGTVQYIAPSFEIGSLNGEKDSISLLGMQLSKTTYNIILWSAIGILLALLLFSIARMQVAVTSNRDARIAREKTAEELEKSRKNRLEVEQKLRRQLQDERNKRGGAAE